MLLKNKKKFPIIKLERNILRSKLFKKIYLLIIIIFKLFGNNLICFLIIFLFDIFIKLIINIFKFIIKNKSNNLFD